MSGDGDFVPAIAELQPRGAKVTVIANKGMLSQQLSEIADDLIFLDDLQYQIAKYTKLSVSRWARKFITMSLRTERSEVKQSQGF